MAQAVRKLYNLGSSSSPISHLIYNKHKANSHGLYALSPWGKSIRCHFSVGNCQDGSSASSYTSDDGAGLSHQEFQRWQNGGGAFHKSACIDPTALIETGAIVHPKSVVGAYVHIGSGTVIGPSVTIGQLTKIGYNVALSNCSIGDSCVIHNGVCIGQDGFGFLVDEKGNILKKPQLLDARVGNHVEIGANTCIDRGSWRDTVIGDHSKIDNLVQIGHNVVVGKSCMLCGQVGIAGSVTIGDYVTFGGRVAVRDHVSIVSKVRLAAISCVTKDIKEPGDYGGFPAVPISEWRRQVASQSRTSKKRVD
ncbi:probable UDP-3-O-acylglucosamine N-acyltransferase 2, mitochondrial isoform X1 [Juglans microcarpa x Juglans regia]|uniref:probable UDP-3-O-acylglucosamine N-acyltransferase 2, mitochondrial isoform X1 n=1 Tax=Juglans microcarpa x Juglans regia TaxID=2249226 RepID=UPI001B7F2246|nr:probable UDP-3-O-acylglucosamine N-acyltransferase 2, mitochondrial isoform X1 [Juglans microcarpa x Juglans regia]